MPNCSKILKLKGDASCSGTVVNRLQCELTCALNVGLAIKIVVRIIGDERVEGAALGPLGSSVAADGLS
jgi:hypothetical protein